MTINAVLWGQARLGGALQELLTVGDDPIIDVSLEPLLTVREYTTLEPLLTVDGLSIQTVDGVDLLAIDPIIDPPNYWVTSDVTTDGGNPFALRLKTNPWQPTAQGGENVFAWAHITFAWSMSALVRVTPYIDGSAADLALPDGSVMRVVAPTFLLTQQPSPYELVHGVFSVPLVAVHIRNGLEVTRVYRRGQRLQLLIETVGALGVGQLLLEGCEVEFEPVRKALYAPFDASSN